MIISKVETTWPQGVKTIEEREACLEKEKVSDFWFLGLKRNYPYEGVAGYTCN